MVQKRFIKTILLSWIVFIGIDFFVHAGLIKSLWKEKVPAFLPDELLFRRIPLGYTGFLLLTLLLGYIFVKVFRERPNRNELIRFAAIVGALFAISNFLVLYSFTTIPPKHLVVFNIVYLVEIIAVIFSINAGLFIKKFKLYGIMCFLLFIGMIIFGIIAQNILT